MENMRMKPDLKEEKFVGWESERIALKHIYTIYKIDNQWEFYV